MGIAESRSGRLIVGRTPRKTIALTVRSLDRWVEPKAKPNLQELCLIILRHTACAYYLLKRQVFKDTITHKKRQL